jgi:glycosyl transferase family 2
VEHESDVAPGLDPSSARLSCDCDWPPDVPGVDHRPWCASVTGFHAEPPVLRPGVTVCIASHPARTNTWLLPALQSVLNQTRQPDAILVVNDVDRHGAGWTRRTLLEAVHTEWIAWLDSDDEWYPNHLEKILNHALETGSIFVFPWFDGGDPLGHFGLEFNPCTPHHTTMGHLVKTEIAKRVGFYDSQPGPFSNEDWLFIVGVAEIACREGLKMTHLPERTWYYRQAGQNSSGQPGQGDAR